MNLPQVSDKKKIYKSYENFLKKWKNPIFSKTIQPISITKIYVIESTKEVMRKI